MFSSTFSFMLTTCIIIVSPQINPSIQTAFAIATLVLESIMACKVFRAMILRSIDREESSHLSQVGSNRNAMFGFGLDTTVELHELEQVW